MMFGLSTADRMRLDLAAQNAQTALTKLQAHEDRCTERYTEILGALRESGKHREQDITAQRASRSRLMWMLGTSLLGIFMLIVKEILVRGMHGG